MRRPLLILLMGFLFLLISCKQMVRKYDHHIEKIYERNKFEGKTVQLDSHQVFYYDNQRENAPVLLFIHGFGGDGKISWKEQIKAFEEEYRVIVPDLLWFGKSKSKADPSLQTQIAAINELTEHLSLQNIHLIGISYGGFVSLGLAQNYKKKWASLTIVDSPGVHFSDKELKAFCKKVGVENVADAFVPNNSEEVKRLMEFSFRKPPWLTDEIRAQTIGIYFSKNPEEQREMLKRLPNNRNMF